MQSRAWQDCRFHSESRRRLQTTRSKRCFWTMSPHRNCLATAQAASESNTRRVRRYRVGRASSQHDALNSLGLEGGDRVWGARGQVGKVVVQGVWQGEDRVRRARAFIR